MTSPNAKPIEQYDTADHGYDHPQYFQGYGVAFSDYEACYTGLGDTLREAIDDAIDQIAEHGAYAPPAVYESWEDWQAGLEREAGTPEALDRDESGEDWFRYFSIRVR